MSSQIPNYSGSNIIAYLNDKFTYQVKSDFQAEMIAFDNAIAKALEGKWRDMFKAAGMTDDSLKFRNPYAAGGIVGVKLRDGRIFTEPAAEADRERAAAAFARIMKLCETLSVDMLDLIGPPGPSPDGRPDEDADYADPRVNYSATVCYCDSGHPAYVEPTTMSQYRGCPRHPLERR